MGRADYNVTDLKAAIRDAGIKSGDNVFIHSNIGFYGKMEGVDNAGGLASAFFIVLKDVISSEGTLVLPTFSYSFCHGEVYDPKETKSECGLLPEFARQQENVMRSMDPNFSIAAWGRLADKYTENPTHESFGKGSFWERFLISGGKILCMNMDCGSTFVHYVERCNHVPYRYNKAFNGIYKALDGKEHRDYAVHFVFDGDADAPCFDRLDKKCRELGLCKISKLGRGAMFSMDVKEYYKLICNALKKEPRFLTAGG